MIYAFCFAVGTFVGTAFVHVAVRLNVAKRRLPMTAMQVAEAVSRGLLPSEQALMPVEPKTGDVI